MKPDLIDLIKPYYAVSIIGMVKNAGKTTVLNKLCAGLSGVDNTNAANSALGLTSIGRDGESTDVVTQTEKPEIFVIKGTIIATAAQLLKQCDITKEILHTTGINTPLGEVVIVKALSDGYVQIGGASINSQITSIIGNFKELGAKKVLVDGAISRKTLSSPSVTDATILCTGASLDSDMQSVIDKTAHTTRMLMLPPLDESWPEAVCNFESLEKVFAISPDYEISPINMNEPSSGKTAMKYLYLKGAVSDTQVNRLIMSNMALKNVKIVVDDPSKIFLSESTYNKIITKGAAIFVRNKINVVALTINPFSAYGKHFEKTAFLEEMAKRTSIPVYNVQIDD